MHFGKKLVNYGSSVEFNFMFKLVLKFLQSIPNIKFL